MPSAERILHRFFPLTRVVLEAYSVFKEVSISLKDASIDEKTKKEVIQKIAYRSICQENYIYKNLDDNEKNGEARKSYRDGISREIKHVFGVEVLVKCKNNAIDFDATLKKINKHLKLENDKLTKRVTNALEANPEISKHMREEIPYIYPNLCSSVHVNLSSVLENTVYEKDGKKELCLTKPSENNLPYLSMNRALLNDVVNDMNEIFKLYRQKTTISP